MWSLWDMWYNSSKEKLYVTILQTDFSDMDFHIKLMSVHKKVLGGWGANSNLCVHKPCDCDGIKNEWKYPFCLYQMFIFEALSTCTTLIKRKDIYRGYNANNVTDISLFNDLARRMHKERCLGKGESTIPTEPNKWVKYPLQMLQSNDKHLDTES